MARAGHPRDHAEQAREYRGTRVLFTRLRRTNRDVGAHYLYETTVGAALPIVQTLRDLVQTGDEVVEIGGHTVRNAVVSIQPVRRHRSVLDARATGARPRLQRSLIRGNDLSGMDVARKIVILAREMGYADRAARRRSAESCSRALQVGSAADFLAALPEHDAPNGSSDAPTPRRRAMRCGSSAASRATEGERSFAFVSEHASVRAHSVDRHIVLFRTRRYHENPLVVAGPGAGREVSGGGVFADLLRLASYLGASL